ncbi:MAG: GNAT family N-acetyltransferase [Bacilli bacterium]
MIRPSTVKDVPACASLMAAHPLWQPYGYTFENQSERLAHLFIEKSVLIAEDDGVVQGFVIYDARTFGDNGYIQLIGIAARHTGKGIGEQLMNAAHANMNPLRRCFLLCTSTNVRAQRFYMRLGYRKVGELPDWLRPGMTEYIFCHYDIQGLI